MDLIILAKTALAPATDYIPIAIIVLVIVVFNLHGIFRGKYKNAGGYVVLKGQNELEHRQIARQILGRELYKNEVVHHINGRPHDNRPQNLCVMDRRAHDRYHEWYDWIYKSYGNYPRRETQLRKLREDFNGILLDDIQNNRTRKY